MKKPRKDKIIEELKQCHKCEGDELQPRQRHMMKFWILYIKHCVIRKVKFDLLWLIWCKEFYVDFKERVRRAKNGQI